MRKKSFLFFLLLSGIGFLCAQNAGIIPTPKQVEMHDGTYLINENQACSVQKRLVVPFVDTNPEQAYILQVTPEGIRIEASSEAGLFYGEQSLKQMMRYFKAQRRDGTIALPCCKIVDFPLLKYRGWMDDISRGPIPNMEFLKRVISTMAEYKMNFFNLYTEHVFKLDKYPDIAPTDGLTAAEINELEEFAAQYHIELFGNQQCLAHAEETIKIPYYKQWADTKANWNPGDENARDFLKYELETVADAYSSPFFNIDCDETEALGNGKAHDYVSEVGSASQVYAQHIRYVYDILKAKGKRVMMWGDIAAKDAEITASLPKDIMMIVWNYAPSDNYEDMMKPFVQQGLEFMVAPGMSMWGSVFPSYETYTKNIANLVRDAYENDATGMMNTAWDDSGESLFNSAWHGMVWAAEMAWAPVSQRDPAEADLEREQRLKAFNELYALQFDVPADQFALIHELEHAEIPGFFNSGALNESLWDLYPTKVSKESYKKNKAIYDLIEQNKYLYAVPMPSENLQYSACKRIAYYVCFHQQAVAKRNMLRHEIYSFLQGNKDFSEQQIKKDIQDQIELVQQVKNMYMKLWDEECRPYSRNIVEARYDALIQELMDAENHVLISSALDDKGSAEVTLRTLFNNQDIYYTVDGREPQVGDLFYKAPFVLQQSSMLKAMTRNAMKENVVTERYILIHKALGKINKLNTRYSTYNPEYAAAGQQALADGIIGGSTYADGTWQGYWGEDIDVEFDFGKTVNIHYFRTRFFQDVYDWIMSPVSIELYTSKNGADYTLYRTLTVRGVDYNSSSAGIYTVEENDLSIKSRYVRVVVKNAGTLPQWHQAKGQASYIFCDELILK